MELWRFRGIGPSVVVGHSVGEVAAAHCAGLLSLEQATSLIYHRGRQLRKTSGSGTMMAVLHPADDVLEKMRAKGYDQRLDIAAINSPSQVVVSGDSDNITDLMTDFKSANIRCVQLKVRNAFHSRQQACLEKKFKLKVSKVLRSRNGLVENGTKIVPMLSTVTGRYMIREEASSPEYWWKNIRQQVLFKKVVENLVSDGFIVFHEIGPHQALTPAVRDTISSLQEPKIKPVTSGSLVRPRDTSKLAEDRVTLLLNHAQLFVSGVPVNFTSYYDKDCTTAISIPKYPWQRELCTAIDPDAEKDLQFPVKHHPLLGEEQVLHMDIPSATPKKWWKSKLTKTSVPWLKDHIIGGSIIFPAAAYIEVSFAVGKINFPGRVPTTLRNVDLQKFMYVSKGEGLLETTTEQLTPSKVHATIRSCDPATKKWTRHMETDIVNQTTSASGGFLDVEAISAQCNISLTVQTMKEIKERSGLRFGPSFQTTDTAFVNDNFSEMVSYCESPDVIFREFKRYIFHPVLLDGCLQSYGLLIGLKQNSEAEERGTLVRSVKQVPSKMKSFSLYRNAPRRIVVHLSSSQDDDEVSYCDITVADAESNEVVAKIDRLQFQRFESDSEIGPHIWSTNWLSIPGTGQKVEQRRCLIIPDQLGMSSAVEEHLHASGVSTVVANVTTNTIQTIRHYFDESPSITDILVLQPLDMVNLQRAIDSTDTLNLEEFRKVQAQFPLFCKMLLLEITDLSPDIWPRMIFITAGAQQVFSGENINVFMSHIQSLLMTFIYEEPRLRAISVDVPLEVDATKSSLIIHEAFLNLSDDENVLAYRSYQTSQHPAFIRFAPRVELESTSNFRINTDNQSWIIQQIGGAAKLALIPVGSRAPSSTSSDAETVTVTLHSFCIIYLEDEFIQTETTNSHQSESIVTIYAGVKQDTQCIGSSTAIIGIGNHTLPLSSTMILEPSRCNYVDIPDGIECKNAICAVKQYIPAQIFFHDIFQLPTSAHILYLADGYTSLQCTSFASLAYAKGARLTIVTVGGNSTSIKMIGLSQNGRCRVMNIDEVKNIEKVSVDLLIVPMIGDNLQKQVSILLPSLKKSCTILYLYDGDIKQSAVMSRMAGMKIMTYTTSVSKLLFGQSTKALLAIVNAICEMLKQSRWLVKHLETSGNVPLSKLPLVKGTIPHSTIITTNEEQTKLPFELHSDLWVAEKDASYLVTGGTSGFGLSVVKWLVSRGATHIFVISRQTPRDEVMKYFIQEKTARIQHYSAHVACASEMERILTTIRDSKSPPLTGIFHLATQYKDGFLYQTTKERWNTVMEGKAYGALVLHQLTLKLKLQLKYFVLSSSVIALIGNGGQGNYCAANNFLNSLCQMRRHQGLPGTALCIGFINSVGYAASNNLVKIGEERGMISLTPVEVLKAFNAALMTQMPVVGIGGPLITRRFIQKNRALVSHHFNESNERVSLLKDLLAGMKEVLHKSTGSFHQMLLEKSRRRRQRN